MIRKLLTKEYWYDIIIFADALSKAKKSINDKAFKASVCKWLATNSTLIIEQ